MFEITEQCLKCLHSVRLNSTNARIGNHRFATYKNSNDDNPVNMPTGMSVITMYPSFLTKRNFNFYKELRCVKQSTIAVY